MQRLWTTGVDQNIIGLIFEPVQKWEQERLETWSVETPVDYLLPLQCQAYIWGVCERGSIAGDGRLWDLQGMNMWIFLKHLKPFFLSYLPDVFLLAGYAVSE